MISYDDYVGTIVHVSLVKSFHQSTNSLIHSGQGLPDLKEKIIHVMTSLLNFECIYLQ